MIDNSQAPIRTVYLKKPEGYDQAADVKRVKAEYAKALDKEFAKLRARRKR